MAKCKAIWRRSHGLPPRPGFPPRPWIFMSCDRSGSPKSSIHNELQKLRVQASGYRVQVSSAWGLELGVCRFRRLYARVAWGCSGFKQGFAPCKARRRVANFAGILNRKCRNEVVSSYRPSSRRSAPLTLKTSNQPTKPKTFGTSGTVKEDVVFFL